MAGFFIHISDPGFPDPPFPHERRLGPYNTMEEAAAQAVSDTALGFGTPLGVYAEVESEKRAEGIHEPDTGTFRATTKGKAAYSRSQIEKRAETMRNRIQAQAVATAQEAEEALRAILPEGVTYDDLMKLATAERAALAAVAARNAP